MWRALRKTFDALHFSSMASSSSSGVLPPPAAAVDPASSSSEASPPPPEPKELRKDRKKSGFVPEEPVGQGKPRQPLRKNKPKAEAPAKPAAAAKAAKKRKVVAGTFAKTVYVQIPLGDRAFVSFTVKSLRGLLSQLAKHGYDVEAGVRLSVDLDDSDQFFLLKKGSIIPMHLTVDDTLFVLDTLPKKEEASAS